MVDKRDQPPFPDEKFVECEINTIVAKGMVKRDSLKNLLSSMYKQIGIRFIMRDYIVIITAFVLMAFFMYVVTTNGQERYNTHTNYYGIIMLVSPILYIVLSIFPFIQNKLNGTFEVEMSCKYNIYQIAAFRMLIFSILCFLLNTVWIISMALKFSSVHFVQAFLISTTSLLLFSLLFIYVLSIIKTLAAKIGIIFCWIGINLLLVMLDSAIYYQFLVSVPWYLYGTIICLSTCLYVKKMKEFMRHNKMRGANGYVNG
ncbi:hypothetical protein ACFFHH_23865 [Cytobacillus solani]|uniref:Uncharacterized protein n=1 Tax=Cytobacillus solani TaxID=1637975 RepID=A0A0Q3VI10_9BACI|nr:hypothetical protein [Cytobacillus solani]KOP82654.1 hypothetical protein AMS60_09285 [Bacillus sp. FJAT-21945]KQL19667.1 hypothetical protein AN957_14550 [Cytobacillus solani]